MIHELRIYHCISGQLPALLKRFDEITLSLWEKHGVHQMGFWTVEVGPSNQDLYYILEWKDMGERDLKWTNFINDPEWLQKKAVTEKDGAIVASVENIFLRPTAFSAMK
ncbi:MAG: NIPSNAP family protein [Magnetovibrio sp.]|nr:NIPSNAP family protein [Magnetovibrio sp.]|tara:strand:+ start:1385 stop:1711 length:327 start_codon:yes stop_codon:yes gene_type:complete